MFVCILLRESESYETRNGTVRPGLKGRGGAGGGQGRRWGERTRTRMCCECRKGLGGKGTSFVGNKGLGRGGEQIYMKML